MSALPIVILGAGPAGMAAAEAASRKGQPVLLVDENPAPGGQIWRGSPGALWQELRARPHVSFLGGTRAVAGAGRRGLLLDTPSGPRMLAWERAIVCTGARELLLPFPGWTLPGVLGAGGLQALIKGGMPVAGKRIVVAGSGPLLLAVADTARRHGARVLAIAEHQPRRALAGFFARLALSHRAKAWQAMRLLSGLRGVRQLHGALVQVAHAHADGARLRGVVLEHAGRSIEIDCDFLACGFGLVPSPETAALFGCAIAAGRVTVDAFQCSSVPGVWAAGESTGIGGVDKALAEGRIAGLNAIGAPPSAADLRERERARAFAALLAQRFAPPQSMRAVCTPSTIVCRCEDVRASELGGHADWRSAKLQTRVGMGPCQGRVCGAACEFLYGWEGTGLRQPIFPVSAAALATPGG